MQPGQDQLTKLIADLLSEVCCRFAQSDHPVCRCGVVLENPPPVNACCECGEGRNGEAFLAVGEIFPSTDFPTPDVDFTPCDFSSYGVELSVGVHRCSPGVKSDGSPPTEGDYAGALSLRIHDWGLLVSAVRAAFDGSDFQYIVGSWTSTGLEGTCSSSTLSVTVGFEACSDDTPCIEGE